MYLSLEGRFVNPVVQSLLPHRLVDGKLVLQPLKKGGVSPMKPFGFEGSFDRACVGTHEHQKFWIGVFQCLIRFVRMIRVSSRDSVKCRMSGNPFSCLKFDHQPDRLSGSG